MDGNNGEFHAETDAARAGSTPHIVRWILAISLFSAIALLSAIWITGALTRSDESAETSIPAPQAADTAPADPPTVES